MQHVLGGKGPERSLAVILDSGAFNAWMEQPEVSIDWSLSPIRVFNAPAILLPAYLRVLWSSFDSGYHPLSEFFRNRAWALPVGLGMRPDYPQE
jgi:hypothetical protein